MAQPANAVILIAATAVAIAPLLSLLLPSAGVMAAKARNELLFGTRSGETTI